MNNLNDNIVTIHVPIIENINIESNAEPYNLAYRDLNGSIPLAEAFRLITISNSIVDREGNLWEQITTTGWQRQKDEFFWPFDPTNNNNMCEIYPPSIQEVAISRNDSE